MPKLVMSHLVGLRRLRYERVLSQVDLAELAHVSQRAISEFENGRRMAHPRTIRRLAKALRVPPADLFGVPSDGK